MSSDLGSEAVSGLVSTWMGDRLGIPGAVSFSFSQREAARWFPLVWEAAAAAPACLPAPFESVPGHRAHSQRGQAAQRMGRGLQRMAKVISLRARGALVRTIEREGGSVFPLVRQRLLPLRVCPVSRNLSGSSEDGESPSEV